MRILQNKQKVSNQKLSKAKPTSNVTRFAFVTAIALVLILPSFAGPVSTHCSAPASCPGGVFNQNGQDCGTYGCVINTQSAPGTIVKKYCSKINPLYVCGNGTTQCNEQENWYMSGYSIVCECPEGEPTVIGYCYETVVAKVRLGTDCDWCN